MLPQLALEIERLSAGHGESDAIRNLSLHCPPFAITAILGDNGSGKSTLLHAAAGLLPPRAGAVRVGDLTITPTTRPSAHWRERVGFVMHDPDDQLFGSTVCEDIGFGPTNLGLPRDEISRRIDDASSALELDELHDVAPHALSHGQKLRTVIAGTIAMHPSILLLDEPTSGLDAPAAQALEALLLTLRGEGRTVVLSTHDVDLAWRIADAVLVLHRGGVLAQGPTHHVLGTTASCARLGLTAPAAVAVCERLAEIGILPSGVRAPRRLTDALRLDVHPPRRSGAST